MSLFVPRDVAGAIVGDLVEESRLHGRLWYARALLSVQLAMSLHACGAARGRTLWALARGLLIWGSIYLAVRTATALLGLGPLVAPSAAQFADFPLALQIYLISILIGASFVAGLVLGRFPAVDGVNGAAPLAVLWLVTGIVAPAVDLAADRLTTECLLVYLLGVPFCYVLPLLGGAIVASAHEGGRTPGPV